MRKIYALLFITCFGINSLFAGLRPDQGEFSITGEWLYLHPIVENNYYAATASNTEISEITNWKRESNTPGFDSGFRLAFMYGFCDCCSDLRVAWTRLHTDHKESISAPIIIVAEQYIEADSFQADTATSKADFDFDRVETLFGVRVWQNCGLMMTLETGLQYAQIDSQLNNVFVKAPTTNFYRTDSKYWGIGPQLGFDLNYCLCGNFVLTGNVNLALLVGESDSLTQKNNIEFKNETVWQIVPATEIRLGFNYSFCCCLDWSLEVGYEFLSYLHAVNSLQVNIDSSTPTNTSSYANADLHGPYISLSVTF